MESMVHKDLFIILNKLQRTPYSLKKDRGFKRATFRHLRIIFNIKKKIPVSDVKGLISNILAFQNNF